MEDRLDELTVIFTLCFLKSIHSHRALQSWHDCGIRQPTKSTFSKTLPLRFCRPSECTSCMRRPFIYLFLANLHEDIDPFMTANWTSQAHHFVSARIERFRGSDIDSMFHPSRRLMDEVSTLELPVCRSLDEVPAGRIANGSTTAGRFHVYVARD